MTTELKSFQEAAALALAEQGEATPSEVEVSMPGTEAEASAEDGQAEGESVEQTDSQIDAKVATEAVESEVEEESLFGDLEVAVEETSFGITDDTRFELPGIEGQVTLQELKDGFLRTADYTRKTQEVAESRKANEKAVRFWDALKAQPEAVVRQLAAQVGLLDESAAPVKAVEFSPIVTAEEMEAEVNSRVEQALANHPAVMDAEREHALRVVNQELDRIGQVNGVILAPKDRELILQEASRRNVADLELVFTGLMAQRDRKTQERNVLKEAAPARPTGSPSSETSSAPAQSFAEAAQRAMLELGLTATD